MSHQSSSGLLLNALTIKTQLTLIVILLLGGIASYASYEQYSFSQLNQLAAAADENLRSEINLLTLRRHEKDYLSRQSAKYVSAFEQTFTELQMRVERLDRTFQVFSSHQPSSITTTIRDTLQSYLNQFQSLVSAAEEIGRRDNSGLSGELLTRQNQLEQAASQYQDPRLLLALSHLFEQQARYQIHPSKQQSVRFANQLNSFKQTLDSLEINGQMGPEFRDYNHAFARLDNAYQRLGYSHDEGLRGALRANVHQTEQVIHDLQSELQALVNIEKARIENTLHIIGIVITVIVSSLLILMARRISQRMAHINQRMENIASGDGDLTVRLNTHGSDELAQLSRSFDRFVSQLHQHIKEVASTTTQLSQASQIALEVSEQSVSNAEQQKAESASVATAVNQLLMTSNEINQNINHAATSAEHVKNDAQQSQRLTQRAGESCEQLMLRLSSCTADLEQLEQRNLEIQQVVSTIQNIAEQTNLLALNAAIEAARAGEQGRGFAVVADEVRQLSQKTNQSTRQIEATIQGLSNTIKQNVSAMQHSVAQAKQTNEQTSQAVFAIERINHQIGDIFDMNSQIATASEEQSTVSAEVDRTISQIAELAEQTYQLVEQSTQSSLQVRDAGEKLQHVVTQFRY